MWGGPLLGLPWAHKWQNTPLKLKQWVMYKHKDIDFWREYVYFKVIITQLIKSFDPGGVELRSTGSLERAGVLLLWCRCLFGLHPHDITTRIIHGNAVWLQLKAQIYTLQRVGTCVASVSGVGHICASFSLPDPWPNYSSAQVWVSFCSLLNFQKLQQVDESFFKGGG